MKTYFRLAIITLFFGLISSTVSAQGLSLKDRSVIELSMGLWGGSKVSNTIGVSGIKSTADASSFIGSVLYSYGLREEMAVTLSAGVLGASASADVGILGTQEQAGTVIPVLLGVRYYVPYPDQDARVRPFVSLGVGPYIGLESSSSIGMIMVQESRTEAVFGGRLGIGVDLYTGYSFKFVANAGYNAMTNFSTPISARNNFDGGDFSIGVGWAF